MVDYETAAFLRRCEEETKIECKCQDCGKEFYKGDEGDNEHYCLKCEAIAIALLDSELDY